MPSIQLSPKRKRSDYDLHTPPPSSRLKTTNLPTHNIDDDADVAAPLESPRTTVAGHLQNLDLNGKEMPSLNNLRNPISAAAHPPPNTGSALYPDHHPILTFSLDGAHEFNSGPNFHLQQQQQQQQIPPYKPPTPPNEGGQELEVPETPRLKPVTSPLLPSPGSSAKISSPLPSPRAGSGKQALWWSEREITGHELSDKDDDGEGINGVGFLPTPAIAHARAERRKRQVRDWKEREAREARQKRSERRLCRRGDVDCGGGNNNNTIKEAENNRGSGEVTMGRKVRFLEA